MATTVLAVTHGDNPGALVDRWVRDYCADAPGGDMMAIGLGKAGSPWRALLEEVVGLADGSVPAALERVQRQANEIGAGYRLPGDSEERPWPLSPLPVLIEDREWQRIETGIIERAELMETLLTDIYGDQRLIGGGLVPAALITGSPHFLRPLVGLDPPGGNHLYFYAADLARGPGGDWRVLADHLRAPTGAGYALENRLAMTRAMGALNARIPIRRLAPFFTKFREGLAAACRRTDPRIGLLTPGRYNQSYAEQAHLARYLGLMLVEGADLAVHEERLYVRTIEGLKRIDAIWRRVDPRMVDPLAFDSRSRIGVPGIIDAMAAGNVMIANAPGAGALESPAMSAFLPKLSLRLHGRELALPNIATWWCGQRRECEKVEESLDSMLVGPAFGTTSPARMGSEIVGADRDALLADLRRRPMDYAGQEIVKLATTPMAGERDLVARPFTIRVFAARDADGRWTVMPGGFARIGDQADVRAPVMGEGAWSADVCIVTDRPVAPVSLLSPSDSMRIRRNPGTLPSRVADNLYWLGRYLERAEATLALIRTATGGSADGDAGATVGAETIARLGEMLVASGAASNRAARGDRGIAALAGAALDDGDEPASVRGLLNDARSIAEGSRERLSPDVWRLLDIGSPKARSLIERSNAYQQRFAALAGLAAEHMGRTEGWRFHDLGRRIERAITVCRLLRAFAGPDASADDLTALLDLNNSQISYRQRYQTGLATVPVRDLVALDPYNPRSLAFQVEAIAAHLRALPALGDDGMAEPQQAQAYALAALVTTTEADALDPDTVLGFDNRLMSLSDALARRYFLRGSETIRAPELTLA